jgi:chromosome segregation ATPase
MVKSTHVNWRQLALDLQPKIEDTERDVQALRQEKIQLEDAIRHERAALRSALIALEIRAMQTEELLKQKTATYVGLEAERLKRIEELTAIENELKVLVADITKLEEDIQAKKLESATHFDQAVVVTAQIHEAVGLHRRLSERYEQLRLQIERIREGMPAAAAAPADASTGSVR